MSVESISVKEMKRAHNLFLTVVFIAISFVIFTIIHIAERREKEIFQNKTSITDEN